MILVVCNFTPVARSNYRLGVPRGGWWQELLNSDATQYGGTGHGNFGGIEASPVAAEIDGGRFPIKRTIGEEVKVEADAFTDGHDVIACVLLYRKSDETMWREAAMQPMGNDRWRGGFHVERTGCYHYCICAWVDHFASWRRELVRRTDDEDIKSALLAGKLLIDHAASRAQGADALRLRSWAQQLSSISEVPQRVETALDDVLAPVIARYPVRSLATFYDKELKIEVERERARFGAWYEMFPRSCGDAPGRHGTFRDCSKRLPYVASMG